MNLSPRLSATAPFGPCIGAPGTPPCVEATATPPSGPCDGARGPRARKLTDDVHNPAVNWYSFHDRDGLVRRRMRFARM